MPFQLEGAPARGRVVRMDDVVDEILSKHDYPDGIGQLLAHALMLVSILGNTIKFDGKLIMQAQGNGPVSSMVADYKTPGEVRGWVRFDPDAYEKAIADGFDAAREVPQLLGAGHLAFTIDQGPDTERYQGIVGLEGATLAECAQTYFDDSEQLPTIIKLAADRQEGKWRAGGIMLQHLANTGGNKSTTLQDDDEDTWREGAILMASATNDELLADDISAEALLFRLFHERGVRVFDAVPVGVLCQCTRDHIGGVLAQFSDDDLGEMIVDGQIVVTCEFCNKDFLFDPPA